MSSESVFSRTADVPSLSAFSSQAVRAGLGSKHTHPPTPRFDVCSEVTAPSLPLTVSKCLWVSLKFYSPDLVISHFPILLQIHLRILCIFRPASLSFYQFPFVFIVIFFIVSVTCLVYLFLFIFSLFHVLFSTLVSSPVICLQRTPFILFSFLFFTVSIFE